MKARRASERAGAGTKRIPHGVDGNAALKANGAVGNASAPLAKAALPPLRAPAASGPTSDLDFAGCDGMPATYEQYMLLRDAKRRIELWDRGAGMAWELRDGPTGMHEWPIYQLKEMMVLMAAVRGLPVPCYGSRGLALLDDNDQRLRVLHPDQSVYLHRPGEYDGHGDIPVRRCGYPDIVMEVDNTTDTRKGKLKLYEDMGVPELWIDVPELWLDYAGQKPPRRPRGLVPGLTIFLLEDGRYKEHPASKALLGWKAEEIHVGLNDRRGLSPSHCEMLARLGQHFGAQTRTGPDDHPLMRMMRQQSRDEGRSQGMAEGQAAMVRQVLQRRGIALSPTFPANVPNFADVPADALLDAAMACDNEQDFQARLQRL